MTKMQKTVYDLRLQGYSNKEISVQLGIVEKTVEFHFHKIKAEYKDLILVPEKETVIKDQWYITPTNKFALIMSTSELEAIVSLQDSIAKASLVNSEAINEFSKKFIKNNWKLWNASFGRLA